MNLLRYSLMGACIAALSIGSADAQVFFSEDFEGTMNATTDLPTGWTETGLSSDGIYSTGDDVQASSPFLPYPAHTVFAYSNDDDCNCDKSADRLILPTQNFTGRTNVSLIFDEFFADYGASSATVEVSTNGGTTWNVEYALLDAGAWTDGTVVDLSAYDNAPSVTISFFFNDGASWEYGVGIDNVILFEQPSNDLAVTNFTGEYVLIPESQVIPMPMEAEVTNVGTNNATDAIITANVYDPADLVNPIQTFTSTPTAVNAGASVVLNAGSFTPPALGTYAVEYIVSAATFPDANALNDTLAYYVFAVTEDQYSREDGQPSSIVGLPNATLRMGSLFDINSTTTIDSVAFASQGQAAGDSVQIEIYDVVGGLPNAIVGESTVYNFTAADAGVGAFFTLAVTDLAGQPFVATGGNTYFVAVRTDYEGELDLLFCDYLFRPNTSYVNVDGGAFIEMGAGVANITPMIRPILGTCDVNENLTVMQDTCNGGYGMAMVAPTNGFGTYTYAWSTGATTPNVSGLMGGMTYSVTVTDGLGCTADTTFTVNNFFNSISENLTVMQDTCNGGYGSAMVMPTGGQGGYTYLWSTGATTQSITGLVAGNYAVTVTDGYGCSTVKSDIVANFVNTINLTASTSNASCGNPNGQATITATPAGTYTYLWSTGATTATITNLTANTYSVTVTDPYGCSAVDNNVTVGLSNGPSATGSATDVSCNGGADGSIDLNVTGGTTPYTYLWSNGGTTSTITGLVAGNYGVTVTDASGCILSQSFTVNEPTMLMNTGTVTDVSCNGGADGEVTASVTGGTAPYTYLWSNGATTSTTTSLIAGTYTVTTTDANGCSAVNAYTVNEPTALVATSTIVDATCNGATDGMVTAAATGGTAPYSYAWSTGATVDNIMAGAGTYDVTITDANGCTTTGSYTIAEPTAVVITETIMDVTCNGGVDGMVSLAVTGGAAPYTYLWNTGATADNITVVAGTYNVTVTDANGCTSNGSYTVNEPTVVTVTETVMDATCNGAMDGMISVAVAGGTAPYTYLWNSGETTDNIMAGAGAYDVVVTDANGCTASGAYTISEPDTLGLMATVVDDTLGAGGAIDLMVTGGTAPYSYAWSSGDTTEDLTGLTTGAYDVTVTDANGCTATASFSVGFVNIGLVEGNFEAFNLYPNPTKGIATLDIELAQAEDIRLEVMTITGQLLYTIEEGQVLTGQYTIDVSDYPSGVYMIRLTANEATITRQLIRE